MSELENKRVSRWRCGDEEWGQKNHFAMHARGSIWTGVFILLIGLAFLIRNTVPDIPHWVFSWQMLLVALGLFIGVKERFRGIAWFVLLLVGWAFLIRDIVPDLQVKQYIWPMVLILVGLFFIIRPGRRKSEKKNGGMTDGSTMFGEETWSKEDFVDSTSIFGGAKKNIISKNFKGGDLVNIFGGTDLDLTQADFTGTAVIELTTIFGGTKLIIPSNWSIKSDAVIIFGGLEDKRKMQTIAENPDKTLVLKGTVIFGGIDIKSY